MKTFYKFGAIAAAAFMLSSTPAAAQLEQYKDYDVSDAVWNVTTVKIDANMEDYYLQGLKSTWMASNAIAKKLGHLEDYSIYLSDLPSSGEFNMLLIVKFANTSDLAPNKAKYDAFMKEWTAAQQKQSRETSKNLYPNIRKITGSYNMREVTVK